MSVATTPFDCIPPADCLELLVNAMCIEMNRKHSMSKEQWITGVFQDYSAILKDYEASKTQSKEYIAAFQMMEKEKRNGPAMRNIFFTKLLNSVDAAHSDFLLKAASMINNRHVVDLMKATMKATRVGNS